MASLRSVPTAFSRRSTRLSFHLAVVGAALTCFSQAAMAQGGGPVPAPPFSLASGVYAAAQTVSITDANSGAAIYYTTAVTESRI